MYNNDFRLTMDPYKAIAAAEFNVPYAEVTTEQRDNAKQAWFMWMFERNRNHQAWIFRREAVIGDQDNHNRTTNMFQAFIQPEDVFVIDGKERPYEGIGFTAKAALHALADALPESTSVGWDSGK